MGRRGGRCGAAARVLDVCAAPGGKATAMATAGARVIAADQRLGRARLVQENAATLDLDLPVVVADGAPPPFRPGSFDAVLLDAPCSGLGALRRRADARWRIQPSDIDELAELQSRSAASAAQLVAPGGRLVYSVCTLTAAESIDHRTPDGFRGRSDAAVDRHVAAVRARLACAARTTPTPTAWC